ncbi:MAG: diaminopimelate epimerase [Gammaproteobacteria bacterium]|jgi:diaminopimelate epimerase|nr:diaminopimelate epimerase [Gammaproteobacteria bacterium]
MITFHKMHGIGNDFVITENLYKQNLLNAAMIKKWSNRNTGIGFDQLLDIEALSTDQYKITIFNADGTQALQCGNGLRCVASLLLKHEDHPIELQVANHRYVAIKEGDLYEISMGKPSNLFEHSNYFEPSPLVVLGKAIDVYLISLGNPHCMVLTDQLIGINFENHASIISTHPQFASGINVSFVMKADDDHFIVRTYERGAGETMACASAASAVSSALFKNKNLKKATILFKGGLLYTRIDNQGTVYQKGPAEKVFTGQFNL